MPERVDGIAPQGPGGVTPAPVAGNWHGITGPVGGLAMARALLRQFSAWSARRPRVGRLGYFCLRRQIADVWGASAFLSFAEPLCG